LYNKNKNNSTNNSNNNHKNNSNNSNHPSVPMASRMLWRPLMGGAVWTSAGVAMGAVVATSSTWSGYYIYSTSLVAASLGGGAVLVLLPLGVSRGILHSLQEICHVHGRPALQQALLQLQQQAQSQHPQAPPWTTPEGTQQLLERLTLGSGWQGRVVRSLASPFLPSTTQMMVRLQEQIDNTAKQTPQQAKTVPPLPDSHVRLVVTAVDGFMEGFLQDKKDTITTLGVLAYAGVVGLGLGVDYAYRRANQESHHEIPPTTVTTTTSTTEESTPKPVSPNDEPAVPVTEWIQRLFFKGKKHADPYVQQAVLVAGSVKEEMTKQGVLMMEQATQVLSDEKNQEQFQEQWNTMIQSIKDVSPDDATVKRISQEMQEILQQAQQRLNEDDVKEMQKDLQDAMNRAGQRIVEEGKQAKVEEKMEQMGSVIRDKLLQWWWWRRGAGGE
jgi:hypothetical protein